MYINMRYIDIIKLELPKAQKGKRVNVFEIFRKMIVGFSHKCLHLIQMHSNLKIRNFKDTVLSKIINFCKDCS